MEILEDNHQLHISNHFSQKLLVENLRFLLQTQQELFSESI